MFGFQVEQQALPFQAAPEPNQTTRSSDDAVAGHYDGNRVAPVRRPDRSHRPRRSDLRGNFGITAHLAVWNGHQRGPDLLLKFRAHQLQRQIENLQLASEIKTKLPEG